LAYLHTEKVVHGDIKSTKILVGEREEAILCGPGFSQPLPDALSDLKGTDEMKWLAPELHLEGFVKSFASDVYAFGVTIAEVG
jgi:serine/threonine protein kinase